MLQNRTLWAASFICFMLYGVRVSTPRPAVPNNSSVVYTQEDSLIFLEKQKIAAKETALTAKTLAIAYSFLKTPYVNGTLDVNRTEQLVINLQALDCWTFVENSFALALANQEQGSFDSYRHHLLQLRYWGGSINGYGSRIHYFTGWVLQAEKLGLLRNLTQALGGVPLKKKINYITAHPDKYPRLKQPEIYNALDQAERRITAHPWYFIPKANIKKMENQIREGDLLLLCSSKTGLDISHEGFAVRQNGRIHLMHASSLHRKVIISGQPLAEYMAGQRGQSGIMVLRIVEQ